MQWPRSSAYTMLPLSVPKKNDGEYDTCLCDVEIKLHIHTYIHTYIHTHTLTAAAASTLAGAAAGTLPAFKHRQ